MPIYLRKFYFKKLLDVKKEEKKHIDKTTKKSNTTVYRPNIPKSGKFPRR